MGSSEAIRLPGSPLLSTSHVGRVLGESRVKIQVAVSSGLLKLSLTQPNLVINFGQSLFS